MWPMKRCLLVLVAALCLSATPVDATTKGLSQIITPELQPEGDFSLSLQIQDKRIANPYELQVEVGITKWVEVAVFQGFKPNEEVFATEIGILTKEPWLLSTGFINWSPRRGIDPQPFIEGGYYTEHHKFIAGLIHAGYKNQAVLGYAHDFNKQWRAQIDFISGAENSTTLGFTWNITPDLQMNPAIYFANYHPERVMGYVVFTYTFHLWAKDKKEKDQSVPGG
jgi:hypothetical protein